MVRLPPHARGRERPPEPARAGPTPLSTVGTWRWSLSAVAESPLLLATVCLVGTAIAAVAAVSPYPVVLLALLAGYLVESAVAGAYVSASVERAGRPGQVRVLRAGAGRLRALGVVAIVLAVVLTVLLEAAVHVLATALPSIVLVQVASVLVLACLAASSFAGPAAVLDRQPPLQAVLDGWLLAGDALADLLALHVSLLALAAPAGIAVALGGSAATVAVGAWTLGALGGLLALSIARTYVTARDRQEMGRQERTPAWKLEGSPVVRE